MAENQSIIDLMTDPSPTSLGRALKHRFSSEEEAKRAVDALEGLQPFYRDVSTYVKMDDGTYSVVIYSNGIDAIAELEKENTPASKQLLDKTQETINQAIADDNSSQINAARQLIRDGNIDQAIAMIGKNPAIISKKSSDGKYTDFLSTKVYSSDKLSEDQKLKLHQAITDAAAKTGNVEALTWLIEHNNLKEEKNNQALLEHIKDKIESSNLTAEQKESLSKQTQEAITKAERKIAYEAIEQGDPAKALELIKKNPAIISQKIGDNTYFLSSDVYISRELSEENKLNLYEAIADAAIKTNNIGAINELIRRSKYEDKNLLSIIKEKIEQAQSLPEGDKEKILDSIEKEQPKPQNTPAVPSAPQPPTQPPSPAAIVTPPVVTPPAATPEPEPILARPATVLAQPEPVLAPPIGSMRAAGDILRSLDRNHDGVVDPSAITKGVAKRFLKAADADGDNVLSTEELRRALVDSKLNVNDARVNIDNGRVKGMEAAIEVLGGALRKAGVTVSLADTSDNSTFPDNGVRVFLEQSKQNGARGPR